MRLYYGVWDGVVHDNRGTADYKEPEGLDLKNLLQFNNGNPVMTFISHRGFLVFHPDQCHGRSLTDAAETRISHHAGNIEKTFPIDRLPFQGLFQGLRNNDRAASAGRTFAAGKI